MNNLPQSMSFFGTSLRQKTALSERANHIRYASSNPALSYVYSLAATDTTGGQANARYTLERFARYNLGDSFQLIDWKRLFKSPLELDAVLQAFFIHRAKSKAAMKNQPYHPDFSLKNLQIKPLLNALEQMADHLMATQQLSSSEVMTCKDHLSRFDLHAIEQPKYQQGWLSPTSACHYSLILTPKNTIMLEAFSCFCIRSCIERFDWINVLYAPLLQSTMQAFLSDNRKQKYGDHIQSYSPATADNLLRMLRGVAQHAWLAELISVESLARIKAIKLPRGSRQSSGRYLSYAEMDEISAITLAQKNTIKAMRDHAIFWLMYEAGLRRAEVVGLNLQDVDLHQCRIRVVGKGNKERYVPFSAQSDLYQTMTVWLKLRESEFSIERPALFCTINRYQSLTWQRLTTQTLNDLCKKLQLQGFNRVVSPHDFRHSVATNLLRAGYDLLLVSKFMGHSSITTTQRYDRRTDDELKGVVPVR